MPIFQLLPDEIWFPGPELFEPDQDVVAIGGDISPGWLIAAYRQGIFPWFSEGEPIMWWHPRQRFILKPGEVKVSKSTRNLLNRQPFTYSFNTCFEEVIEACQKVERPGQSGTWLSDEIKNSMIELHRRGHAYSVECWQNGNLVGGLYGIMVGGIFMGDSMFSRVSNASKLTFINFCRALHKAGFALVDCQVYTPYLASLGAHEIPRQEYLHLLHKLRNLERPDIRL